MKKIYGLLLGLAFVGSAFAQPYTFPLNINPADTGLVSSPQRRTWEMVMTKENEPIIVDGVKDAQWDLVTPQAFDRFILCRTGLTNGVYACNPDGAGTWTPNRIPNSKEDFSGSFRVIYDEDYLYAIYDVTDNEVNDGVINAGVSERLELVEAPYPDSIQQKWNGSYPPYSGTANEIAKKFAYWNYLGAFKWNFFLIADGKCNMGADEKADAMAKIDYVQRTSSCQCAWKLKSDGTGYILEAALSLKIGLSDSSNNPYVIPTAKNEVKQIAFDMFMFDFDQGSKQIKASWNAQDDNVWDAMLYTGKLTMRAITIGTEDVKNEEISFLPNPATEVIKFNKLASSVQVIGMNGVVAASAVNVNELNVSQLASGIYEIIVDGKPAGKLQKQ